MDSDLIDRLKRDGCFTLQLRGVTGSWIKHRAISLRSRHSADDSPLSPLAATTLSGRPPSPRKFLPILSPVHPPLARLIKSLNPLLSHHRSAASSTRTTAHLLSSWSAQTGDDAVSDVADKFGVLLAEMANLEESYSEGIDDVKMVLKTIQDVENSIRPAKTHQTKLRDQVNKASIKPEAGRKLEQLERELVRADAEVLVADAQLLNVTRERLRVAWRVQLDALQERCEKELVLVKYGREILRFLDGEIIVPGQNLRAYRGEAKTRDILGMVEDELRGWSPGWGNAGELCDDENVNGDVSVATAAAAAAASATASMVLVRK
ncbi:Eisosome component PIL1-domain-containing protein [Lipomyces doorenjongii]